MRGEFFSLDNVDGHDHHDHDQDDSEDNSSYTLSSSGNMGSGGNPQNKTDTRKSNKPIMEKRRRARINNCLNDLKSILLEAMRKDPARHSKLEKADILELTVRHLQNIQRNQLTIAMATDPTVLYRFKNGFSECATEVGRYLSKLEGVDDGMKSRIQGHLGQCVTGLQQPQTPPQTLPVPSVIPQFPRFASEVPTSFLRVPGCFGSPPGTGNTTTLMTTPSVNLTPPGDLNNNNKQVMMEPQPTANSTIIVHRPTPVNPLTTTLPPRPVARTPSPPPPPQPEIPLNNNPLDYSRKTNSELVSHPLPLPQTPVVVKLEPEITIIRRTPPTTSTPKEKDGMWRPW